MNIKNLDNGFLIDGIFAYGCDQDYSEHVNLKKTIWEEMKYEKSDNVVVDFPGEYDIRGFGIEVVEEKELLHFIITKDDLKFAVVSHKKALTNEKMDESILTRVLSEEALREQLEKHELEWDVVILE